MRAVVQRVSRASVRVGGEVVGAVDAGLCVLVGVGRLDDERDAAWLARKVSALRIFEDEAARMNRSLLDVGGSLLAISQFTLYGDASRGNRPSFTEALEPERALPLFERFCDECRGLGVPVAVGRFRAEMSVELVNEGPVTLVLESRARAGAPPPR